MPQPILPMSVNTGGTSLQGGTPETDKANLGVVAALAVMVLGASYGTEYGYHIETGLSVYVGIMRCLREAVRLKRPERWQNNDWILHVGNARPHTAHVVLQFLAKHSTIQIPHPPYSPDLAPNDFFLYPKLKMNLKGWKFDNVDMIQAESKATLRNLSKSDFISCFDNWKKRWNGCIEAGGVYFEKY
ncbi:hypothetical protein LAZ67_1005229 [Cordylochernes scorpioides]|uniref:Transposase n=1 Tax=Cordylochernes scorpioides TaxID=51811 RepID=A0ABY6JXZ8_9ARAC|nr:hypothetical protein LAZ67_1005229 [Cordylochernes scorpioides]